MLRLPGREAEVPTRSRTTDRSASCSPGSAGTRSVPAHLHYIVSADGFDTLTTHIFDPDDPYIESDAVFGVKDSLLATFAHVDDAGRRAEHGIEAPFHWEVEADLVLARPEEAVARPVTTRRSRIGAARVGAALTATAALLAPPGALRRSRRGGAGGAGDAGASPRAYLRLVDDLDRPDDGYCLDVLGSGDAVRLDMPLTVHDCKPGYYADEGVTLTDDGTLLSSAYAGCVTAMGVNASALPGSALMLKRCGERTPFPRGVVDAGLRARGGRAGAARRKRAVPRGGSRQCPRPSTRPIAGAPSRSATATRPTRRALAGDSRPRARTGD